MNRLLTTTLLLFSLTALVACGGTPGGADVDSGTQADAGNDLDAGVDVDADAGAAGDAGTQADAGSDLDGGADGGADGGFDGGADGGFDGGADAGFDAGIVDPPPPVLKPQVDRVGRPGVNSLLVATFNPSLTAQGQQRDAYNADALPANWGQTFGPALAQSLAMLDGLDTVCGNQLLADPTNFAGRYDTLSEGVFAVDALYVNTAAASCSAYMAVELNAIQVIANADCGGRKLDYDVIDPTYSLLIAGSWNGLGDGVPADADTRGETFPYLAAPH